MNCYFEAIDHVQLAAPVGSEDEAQAFFRDVLGLRKWKSLIFCGMKAEFGFVPGMYI